MRRSVITPLMALMLILLAVVSGQALKRYLTVRTDIFLRKAAARTTDAVQFAWQRLEIRPWHLDLILHQAKITGARGLRVNVDRIIFSPPLTFWSMPYKFTLGMTGIHAIGLPAVPRGLSTDPCTMTAAMDAGVLYDPDRCRLEITRLNFTAPPLGNLGLSLVLDHFYPGRIKNLDFDGLRIQTLSLTYQDQSLAARLIDQDLAGFLTGTVDLAMASAQHASHPDQAGGLKGLKAYLETPGCLGLEIQLNRPVDLSRIIYARRFSDFLNMITYRFTNA
ncbi:MAG: hypothetical protein K9K87_14465 [Desulfotignum sp.]|nr:hypothetical protein [Desulfotignum sp.]